ncbi:MULTISPECIES: copper resistance protein B [unclassified Rhodanobacter]|uniref:copper resistance protein B n=1 Tax=unclassified Rhodanobacter TaxID=2621553 RepID=UPI001BDEE8D6|nr:MULTISPECIES: copper resistance protein B [unclassified Rhodanobacter]MBT2142915.1 copper resistance protein B [Rhodanobacter sp. LX-99]MBT2148012.1 copper resistance protein B [Rhodanobacter sp. LX-100]
MRMHRRDTTIAPPRSALLAALLLALPLAAAAQSAPAASSSTAPMAMGAMPGMDHAGMHGMAMPATAGSAAKPAAKAPVEKAKRPHAPATPAPSSTGAHDMGGMDHGTMPQVEHGAMVEMDHGPMHGMDHQAMPGMNHGAAHGTDSMPGMTMGPMQGGRAPADARSGDYSHGIAASPVHGLHMHGGAPAGMLLIDQLEAFHGRDANGQSWEIQGWYGSDSDKLWLRSEGERSRGKLEDGNVEVLWNRNVATFWSTQLGVRRDFGAGPARSWAAFGVQGLAPYWFELEATGYAGAGGRTAARLRAEYELLFTQRLILQPEAEINLYGKSDPQRGIGRGISDVQFGLRLRYEIRRQFAPYVGVNWVRRVGTSADYARQDRQPVLDRQIGAGVRIWF